MTME